MKTIIRNASIVNEGKIAIADILMVNERIEKIDPNIGNAGRGVGEGTNQSER